MIFIRYHFHIMAVLGTVKNETNLNMVGIYIFLSIHVVLSLARARRGEDPT